MANELQCPSCGAFGESITTMEDINIVPTHMCGKCGRTWLDESKASDSGHKQLLRQINETANQRMVQVACPKCGSVVSMPEKASPGVKVIFNCSNCGFQQDVSRRYESRR